MTIPFLERLDAPVIGTKYYIANHNENDMPNCTKYGHDRAQEQVGDTSLRLFKDIGIKGFPMADTWLIHSALPVTNIPKLGSICCCSGDGGSIHVFVLERRNDDGSWLISDSRSTADKSLRNDRFWRILDKVRLEVGKSPVGVPGVGKILGFQEIPINDIRTSYDVNKSQITLTQNRVYCRTAPGKSAPILNPGCYWPVGTYDILDTVNLNDGYIWCRVADNCWMAYDPTWAEMHIVDTPVPPQPTPTPDPTTDFDKAIKQFEEAVKAIYEENNKYKEGLKQMSQLIDNLLK